MPGMYRTPSKPAKRTKLAPRRVKSYTRLPTQVKLGKQAFPKQLYNTVKYSDAPLLTLSGGLGAYLFSCNGLYDPNITGTGHQPLYFDQLSAIYDHYTVLRSRIKIRIVPYGASAALGYAQALYIDDDTSVVANATLAAERPGSVCNTTSAANGPATLYLSWDAKKTFGGNPQSQDSLQGTASSNPSEQSYFSYHVYEPSGSAMTSIIYVEIEYDVVWDEHVTIATS